MPGAKTLGFLSVSNFEYGQKVFGTHRNNRPRQARACSGHDKHLPPVSPTARYSTPARKRSTCGPAKPPKLVSSTGSVTKKCPAPGMTTVRAKKPACLSALRKAL